MNDMDLFPLVLGLLLGIAFWATWPMCKPEYVSLWKWIKSQATRCDDSISFHELRCEKCGELIGDKKHSMVVEQNRLWWTCTFCHSSNHREIVGVTTYE